MKQEAKTAMTSVIDEVLRSNDYYANTYSLKHLSSEPIKKLAVVTCMDVRTTVEQMLGLRVGDAHIIRNAGGIVTDDALRSLLISYHLKGMREVMVINHTDCGMMMPHSDADIRAHMEHVTGRYAASPLEFYAFTDLETNVRAQVAKVRTHPWFMEDVVTRGFIYDINTGRLREVV